MASSIQILRSTVSRERPLPSGLLDGQPAVNLNATEPGLFFKAADGSLIKIGPAAITYDGSPPNTPASGNPGHCVGELWLDASTTPNTLKIFDGSQWRVASSPNAVDTVNAGTGISVQRAGNTVTVANTGVTSLVAGPNISLSGSTGQVTISATGGGGGGGTGLFVRWIYTASGGETVLSGSSGGIALQYEPGMEEVFINGVLLTRGADYTAVTGSSVTGLAPLTAGDVATVISTIPLSTSYLPGVATLLRWTNLATAGQTQISGNDQSGQFLTYTPGFEEVFINGVLLRRGIDYTATNGSVITFSAPLTLNDEITVLAFSEFQIVDPDAIASVTQFGAVGDGVTDDTAAIQAAVNSGQPINFPPGTYIISSPIFLQSGTTLISAGKARIKQINNNPNRASFFAMLVAEGAVKQDITLRGLVIDGNAQNNVDPGVPNPSGNQNAFWSGTMLAQIAFSNVKNVTIEDCVLENSFGSGMWITSCEGVRVTGNTVRSFRITGIAIRDYNLVTATQSERAIVANNIVEGGVVGIHGIFGARSATITGNSLSNLKDANRFPSYAYSGTYPNVWPTTGGFKTASDPGYVSPALPGDGAGVELTGGLTDPTSDINNSIDITGNTAYSCMVGFRSEETSKNVTITGNSSRLSDQAGILVFSATQTTVSSNTITESQNTGIIIRRLEASVNPSAVRTENVSVIGNTVTGSAFYGMALGGVRYVTVVGNVFSGNNTLNSPTGGSVTMFKIDSDPCENCIFTGNQFVNANGNEAYGILSGDSGNRGNIVSANFFTNFNVAATNLSQAGNTFANNRGLNIGPINIKEFGATGDGTTNDTTAIQAAIDACYNRGGGEVQVPQGIYQISTMNLKEGVVLAGEGGWASILRSTTSSSTMVQARTSSGIKGIKFLSSVARTGGFFVDVIGNGVSISDCEFGNYYIAINVGSLSSSIIVKPRVTNCAFRDPVIATGSGAVQFINFSNAEIDNCVITGPALPATQPDFGIRFQNGDTAFIYGVNVTVHGKALLIDPPASYNCYALGIDGSVFDSAGTISGGAQVSSAEIIPAGGVFNTRVSNSWFGLSQGKFGCYMQPSGAGVVDGITFTGCEFTDNGDGGLIAVGTGVKNWVVTGGHSGGNTNSGIRAAGGTSFFTITGHRAGNVAGRGPNGIGIVVDAGSSSNYVIEGCNVVGNTTAGISNGATGANSMIENNLGFNEPRISVKDFGAIGNGTADDTTALTAALNFVLSQSPSPALFFPAGVYKVTSPLPDLSNAVMIYGEGPRDTRIEVYGTQTAINIRGTGTRSTDVIFKDIGIAGFGMTAGFAVAIDFAVAPKFLNVSFFDPFNGVSIRQAGGVVFQACVMDVVRGSYGVYAYGTNASRNGELDRIDVVSFTDCLFQSNWVPGPGPAPTAELLVLDGAVHTINVSGLRLLSAKRAVRTSNTPGLPSNLVPAFLTGTAIEAENHHQECYRFEAASDIWINNIFSGTCYEDGIYLGSSVSNFCLSQGSVTSSLKHGINIDSAKDVTIDGVTIYYNGQAGLSTYSGIYATGSGTVDVRGGLSGKATWRPTYTEPQKYGIELANTFTGTVTACAVDLRGNDTGPLYDGLNSASGSQIMACPGYNPLGATTVVVGASPYTYTAGLSQEQLFLSGGTGVSVTVSGTTMASSTPSFLILQPRQQAVITYSTAPTLAVNKA